MINLFYTMLADFSENKAEQTYGEFYNACANSAMSEADAADVLRILLDWKDAQQSAVAHSYGLLMLGGLIDSGKLNQRAAAAPIADEFLRQCRTVDDFRVLDSGQKFIHFVSHLAYLAGSYCGQFHAMKELCQTVTLALLDLFLRSSEPYWCGEELLVARVVLDADLSGEDLRERLTPSKVMQDADSWNVEAVRLWQSSVVVQSHKRQLVMALNAVRSKSNSITDSVIEHLVDAHYRHMFGE